jgi:lipopolysaccharide transport system permease protein
MNTLNGLKELYQYRELLWLWSLRDIKARYKQSLFGFTWAIFQPLALTLIFVVAFSYFIKIPSDGLPYPLFLYSAMLPWTFFTRSLSMGVPSIVYNMNLVTKIYLPRVTFPLAAVFTSFVDFLCGLVVFIGMMFYYRVSLQSSLAILPLLFLIQLILMIGLTLAASALNVFLRDITQMVPVMLQLWMYASPVIYPVSVVPEWLRPYYMLNPMAVIIDGYRQCLLQGTLPAWGDVALAGGVSLIILIVGYVMFKNMEDQFADVI